MLVEFTGNKLKYKLEKKRSNKTTTTETCLFDLPSCVRKIKELMKDNMLA